MNICKEILEQDTSIQANRINVKMPTVKLDKLEWVQVEVKGIKVSGIVDFECQLTDVRKSKIPRSKKFRSNIKL